MSYLGSFKIDDYVPIPAACHRFSSGAAYAPTTISYTIYEEGSATHLVEDVDMVPASPFDGIVGFYYVTKQLTTAAGFEIGKSYVIVIKALVDGVAAIDWHTFQVGAAVDARYYAGTATVAGAVPPYVAGAAGGIPVSAAGGLAMDGLGTSAEIAALDTAMDAGFAGVADVADVVTAIAAWEAETGLTFANFVRRVASALFGETTGQNTDTGIFKNMAATKNRITATTDSNNNRTHVEFDDT